MICMPPSSKMMKLARMARDKGKKQLANLLMEYEKDAVKKIPYFVAKGIKHVNA